MRRKITAFGGGAALVIAAITIPATTAAAADYDIDVDIPSNWAQAESTLTWSIEDTADPICDSPAITVDGGSQPAEIITVNDDGTGGEIDLAAAAGLNLFIFDFVVACGDDEYFGYLEFHSVQINKNVAGFYPYYDPFEAELTVINDDDSEFSDTILFDHDGGSATYYGFNKGEWSIEETEDRGAYRVETDAPRVIDTSDAYVMEITNYFPQPVEANSVPQSDVITTETQWGWESDPHYPPMCDDGIVSTRHFDPLTFTDSVLSTPLEVSVDDQGYSGTIDVSGTPGSGEYYTEVLCEDDGEQFGYWITILLDSFELTKQVEGDSPSGSTFDIEITGSDVAFDSEGNPTHGPDKHTKVVSFTETGGTQRVYHYINEALNSGDGPLFWTVEEIEDGGADDVEIDIASSFYADGYPGATVINTFEVQEPVDDPVDDPKDDPKKDDPEGSPSDEPAAKPVKVVPTYAG